MRNVSLPTTREQEVARTVMQLGMDISSLRTVGHLAGGVTLALRMVGEEIRDIATLPS